MTCDFVKKMDCKSKYYSLIHWDLFLFHFSIIEVQTGKVTEQKYLRSVISCLILAEKVWEEERALIFHLDTLFGEEFYADGSWDTGTLKN